MLQNNMNRNISKKRANKKIKRKTIKIIKYSLLSVMGLLIVLGCIVFAKLFPKLSTLKHEAYEIIDTISSDDFNNNSSSHVYNTNGEEMFEIKAEKDIEYLPFEKIPKDVVNAFIAVEDRRFYLHSGIDYFSLFRAAISLVKNDGEITQGGSTITQQLVKLTYLSSEQSFDRKIKEMYIASYIEKEFSKEEILEFYINNIYFSNGAYGINAASQTYFNKNISELTLSEITFLCAIPNNPSIFNPYTNFDNTIDRRNKILNDMLEEKFITQENYTAAINEEINLYLEEKQEEEFDSRKDYVIKEITEIFMKDNGFTFEYSFDTYEDKEKYNEKYNEYYNNAIRKLYKNGYKIYTSFNDKIQDETQNIIDATFKKEVETNENGIYALQSSTVTIDNSTGLIVSMIGGRTSNETDYLNRAYNTFRQNGSTMKPIGVYGPAFDLLGYVPSTKINDSRIANGPQNSTGYFGNISIRKAIQISSNTVAYKVFDEISPKKGLSYLQKMEFENIVPDDMRLQTSLGGLTIGTNPKEMAAAYATIANNGTFNPAKCITRIESYNGYTIYTHKVKNKSIYKSSSAAMLLDTMKDVITHGTAKGYALSNNIESAGKTGTTNDNKDGWFVGFSPKYTTAVWVGYDQPKTVTNIYGNLNPTGIWKKIMDNIHKEDKNLSFEKSSSVTEVWINSNGEKVPNGQGTLELFPTNNIPKENEKSFDDLNKKNFINKINTIFNKDVYTIEELNTVKTQANFIKNDIANSTLSTISKNELYSMIDNKIFKIEKDIESKSKPTDSNNPSNSNNTNSNINDNDATTNVPEENDSNANDTEFDIDSVL